MPGKKKGTSKKVVAPSVKQPTNNKAEPSKRRNQAEMFELVMRRHYEGPHDGEGEALKLHDRVRWKTGTKGRWARGEITGFTDSGRAQIKQTHYAGIPYESVDAEGFYSYPKPESTSKLPEGL